MAEQDQEGFVDYLRCVVSYRIRWRGHDEVFQHGKVYRIEDQEWYEFLKDFRIQRGRLFVSCFEDASEDEYLAEVEDDVDGGADSEQELPDEKPDWPLKTPPAEYLAQFGDDAKNADMAREVLAWEEANAPEEPEEGDEGSEGSDEDEEEQDGTEPEEGESDEEPEEGEDSSEGEPEGDEGEADDEEPEEDEEG